METIHITMPDGATREVPLGTTAAEIGDATGRNAIDLFRLNHAG